MKEKKGFFKKNSLNGGTQHLFRFKNGYGASIVSHSFSYGQELAVIKYAEDDKFSLCYDTHITNDVLGHQSNEDIDVILKQIEELK